MDHRLYLKHRTTDRTLCSSVYHNEPISWPCQYSTKLVSAVSLENFNQ